MEIEIEGVRPASRFLSWVGKSGKIAAADFYSLISKAKPLTVPSAHPAVLARVFALLLLLQHAYSTQPQQRAERSPLVRAPVAVPRRCAAGAWRPVSGARGPWWALQGREGGLGLGGGGQTGHQATTHNEIKAIDGELVHGNAWWVVPPREVPPGPRAGAPGTAPTHQPPTAERSKSVAHQPCRFTSAGRKSRALEKAKPGHYSTVRCSLFRILLLAVFGQDFGLCPLDFADCEIVKSLSCHGTTTLSGRFCEQRHQPPVAV